MMDGPDKRLSAAMNVDNRGDRNNLRAQRVMAVALSQEALDALPPNVLEPHSYIARSTFDDLDTVVLTGPTAPDLVLAPLLTPWFDAIDLARYLTQAGYRGRYLALVDKLPSAKLIRREVAAQSPDLNFDIVVLDGTNPLHSL